jgi:hypothetical protein
MVMVAGGVELELSSELAAVSLSDAAECSAKPPLAP